MSNTVMPKPPPTVAMVKEEEAKGRVAEIFEDIKRTKDVPVVSHFWRTLANYPPLLEETWQRVKTIMGPGRLDPLTKEMIALAVSITNGCEYCTYSHTTAVKKLGLDDAGLGELMAVVALFNSTNALADGYRIQPDIFPPTDSAPAE